MLITGAAGFAGGFLLDLYLGRGTELHATSRTGRSSAGDVQWHRLDLADADAVTKLIAAVRPTVVHHLAAQSSVSASLQDPEATLSANVLGQLHLLEAIVRHAPESRIVLACSSEEYGAVDAASNPVNEEQPLAPSNPYALSKVTQDLMGYQYGTAFGLHVVRARAFLQIGPRRPDRFSAGAFARQVAEVEAGLRPPVIQVGQIDLRRDFIDVRDGAQAFALLADPNVAPGAYNVASGQSHSLREMLMHMIEDTGMAMEIRQDPARLRRGEPELVVGDASKLWHATGWQPSIPFETSVVDTLNYWRSMTAVAAGGQEGLQ